MDLIKAAIVCRLMNATEQGVPIWSHDQGTTLGESVPRTGDKGTQNMSKMCSNEKRTEVK